MFNRQQGGFFVDMAANDPYFISNTRGLEKHGWNGLCIEGNPLRVCQAPHPPRHGLSGLYRETLSVRPCHDSPLNSLPRNCLLLAPKY